MSCPQTACDWTTERKGSHSNSNQLTDKWGAGDDNVATRHYYYCVVRGSCIRHDVVTDSEARIAGYSAVQAYITAVWAYYRRIYRSGKRDGRKAGW